MKDLLAENRAGVRECWQMQNPVPMAEVWRGGFSECLHLGHAVVCNGDGEIVQAWGDPDAVILPRSSCKMIQALPLLESGAAEAAGLTSEQLALACASHQGAAIHTDRVGRWLTDLGLSDRDLRCGAHMPSDTDAKHGLTKENRQACQSHNNCSGKHAGFLTVTKHLGAGPEYVDPMHPLQLAIRDAFEAVTGESSPGHAIDGCSAPNYATSLRGLARAMGFFAAARDAGSLRQRAATRLVQAMTRHPELVAGEGRACTELMWAMGGKVAVKTGAEGVFVAILPEQRLGVALKIVDGATRASECAMAMILVKLGALDAQHPAALKRMNTVQTNWRGLKTGILRPGAALL